MVQDLHLTANTVLGSSGLSEHYLLVWIASLPCTIRKLLHFHLIVQKAIEGVVLYRVFFGYQLALLPRPTAHWTTWTISYLRTRNSGSQVLASRSLLEQAHMLRVHRLHPATMQRVAAVEARPVRCIHSNRRNPSYLFSGCHG